MQSLFRLLAAVLVGLSVLSGSMAIAGDADPLFVNATSDDAHRTRMALMFASKQQERKHPVTIFLNDKAVLVGAKSQAAKFGEHQTIIAAILAGGGKVLICPMCMEHYGVKKDDLIDGLEVGNPELTGSLLFKDNTKTLSW